MNNKKIAGIITSIGGFIGTIVTLILAYNFMEAHIKQRFDGTYVILANKEMSYDPNILGALSASGLFYIECAFVISTIIGINLILSSKDK